ncbi:MAG: lactate racemase domain-containing protein [Anaerolineales bacterium]|jgi:nickel-dependent lactate racemase
MNTSPLIGTGSADSLLSAPEIRALIAEAFKTWDVSGQRLLVIIPDGTRSAPLPLFFHSLYELLNRRVAKLDFLVALGTHPLMSEAALNRLVGITPEERATRYAEVSIFNHRWERDETFITLGTISAQETEALSNGMLSVEVPIRINHLVLEYDLVVICGPVFPHEVVGFSGGNKYFFPGISGPEVINITHWLGALITSYEIIGTKHTPVRAMIERAAEMVPGRKMALCMVVKGEGLAGLYAGEPQAAWSAAADLSAQVHVRYVEQPFQQVLSVMPEMYDDLWTAAKGMYKLEPVVVDGGEVIIYAPHISEISYTHGHLIDQVGYHVRDYFVKQWDDFKDIPWGVLAHSTHLRGIGTYEDGMEKARIEVTLATGIPPERCQLVNLGYRDPNTVNPQDWMGREGEGILLVPHAGEVLYRLKTTK